MLSYPRALTALFARQSLGMRLELDAIEATLVALGSPHTQLARVVVVGGTNGKGSTAALVSQACARAGYRVGLYTSPHLLRFVERIRVQGEPVSEDTLAALYAEVRAAERTAPRALTFFECATAMAVLAFARARVDLAVLEVGLGGRLDATNAVPHGCAVLTPIDLDHTAILGNTVAAIASEKAAIIPAGGTVVSAPQSDAAAQVIAQVAHERGARLVLPQTSPPTGAAWVMPPYQTLNVATAKAVCAELGATGLACPARVFADAVTHFIWPGRYQWLTPDLLVDGAHNPAGMRALGDALSRDAKVAGRPLHLVFSALADKDAAGMLAALDPCAASLALCPTRSHRSRSLNALGELADGAEVAASAALALAGARRRAAADGGLVLVCGSLFLVGEVISLVTGAAADPPVDG